MSGIGEDNGVGVKGQKIEMFQAKIILLHFEQLFLHRNVSIE